MIRHVQAPNCFHSLSLYRNYSISANSVGAFLFEVHF